MSLGWLLAILGYTLAPEKMPAWGFPLFFESPGLRAVALPASAVFLLGLIAAQWQMGNNWRNGLDEENPTELVTAGFSRYSRIPLWHDPRRLACRALLLLTWP